MAPAPDPEELRRLKDRIHALADLQSEDAAAASDLSDDGDILSYIERDTVRLVLEERVNTPDAPPKPAPGTLGEMIGRLALGREVVVAAVSAAVVVAVAAVFAARRA